MTRPTPISYERHRLTRGWWVIQHYNSKKPDRVGTNNDNTPMNQKMNQLFEAVPVEQELPVKASGYPVIAEDGRLTYYFYNSVRRCWRNLTDNYRTPLAWLRPLSALQQVEQLPADIHPTSAKLLQDFFAALSEKMAHNEKKYGYADEWAVNDWEDDCRTHMLAHIQKGDPRDVAIYTAFMWYHGWSTAQVEPPPADIAEQMQNAIAYIATRFFYHWYNAPGSNTEQGFDAWSKAEGQIPIAECTTIATRHFEAALSAKDQRIRELEAQIAKLEDLNVGEP